MAYSIKALLQQELIKKQNKNYQKQLSDKRAAFFSCQKKPSCELAAKRSISSLNDMILFVWSKGTLSDDAIACLNDSRKTHPNGILFYPDIQMNPTPLYQPEWSPDLFASCFYFGACFAIRKSYYLSITHPDIFDVTDSIVFLHSYDEYLTLYQMLTDCLRKDILSSANVWKDKIIHISELLFILDEDFSVIENEQNYVINSFLISSKDLEHPLFSSSPNIDENSCYPKITVIIPSKDNPVTLKACLSSFLGTGEYQNLQVIIVDNGSSFENKSEIKALQNRFSFEYIYQEMPFHFSKMCNLGAAHADGDYYLFLNDDITASFPDFIQDLWKITSRQHVGATGAKLLYPETDIIQHAGVANLLLGPAHMLQYMHDSDWLFHGQNHYDRNCIAVTAACLMVKADIFHQLNGFSEDFAVAYNDIDFCFRLVENGYFNVVCNDTILYHHESLSRGDDTLERQKLSRLRTERLHLYECHPDLFDHDTFYSQNALRFVMDDRYINGFYYPWKEKISYQIPQKQKDPLPIHLDHDCLKYGIEFAGYLDEITLGYLKPEAKQTYYIQGYSYIAFSDNARFRKFIILYYEVSGDWWTLPAPGELREDISCQIPDQEHVELNGFNIAFEKEMLPEGKYQIGLLAVDTCSRMKLLKMTDFYIS